MSFEKILSQNKALNSLKGFIVASRVPRAMIFAGPAGVGKATTALEFAKTLNCLDEAARKTNDNCGVCQNCKHIDARTHPDIIITSPQLQASILKPPDNDIEKQQNIRVETVRYLTNASQQKPVFAKWKVYIIDNAETLTSGAANALLKFIEEPSPNTVWILISSKKEIMLATIKSRCQTVNFMPLSKEIIIDILKDNGVEAAVAPRAAEYSQGSTAKALLVAEILADFSSLPSGAAFAPAAAMNLPNVLTKARLQAACILDMLAAKAHKDWAGSPARRREELEALLKKIIFYKRAINRNTSPSLVLEAALITAEEVGCKI
jgi:DNA polymerase-3 subunit delta'